jgi:archaeal type IV pilus assembly protein PilA
VFEIMVFSKKNDEAVSPVIGVILMVAITVILAAVIAAFVFGMTGNISRTKVVAVTVTKQGSSGIELTNNGGQDQESLIAINATTSPNPATGCNVNGVASPLLMPGSICQNTNPTVGSTITLTGIYSVRTEVTVVGTFSDGTIQILLNTYI